MERRSAAKAVCVGIGLIGLTGGLSAFLTGCDREGQNGYRNLELACRSPLSKDFYSGLGDAHEFYGGNILPTVLAQLAPSILETSEICASSDYLDRPAGNIPRDESNFLRPASLEDVFSNIDGTKNRQISTVNRFATYLLPTQFLRFIQVVDINGTLRRFPSTKFPQVTEDPKTEDQLNAVIVEEAMALATQNLSDTPWDIKKVCNDYGLDDIFVLQTMWLKKINNIAKDILENQDRSVYLSGDWTAGLSEMEGSTKQEIQDFINSLVKEYTQVDGKMKPYNRFLQDLESAGLITQNMGASSLRYIINEDPVYYERLQTEILLHMFNINKSKGNSPDDTAFKNNGKDIFANMIQVILPRTSFIPDYLLDSGLLGNSSSDNRYQLQQEYRDLLVSRLRNHMGDRSKLTYENVREWMKNGYVPTYDDDKCLTMRDWIVNQTKFDLESVLSLDNESTKDDKGRVWNVFSSVHGREKNASQTIYIVDPEGGTYLLPNCPNYRIDLIKNCINKDCSQLRSIIPLFVPRYEYIPNDGSVEQQPIKVIQVDKDPRVNIDRDGLVKNSKGYVISGINVLNIGGKFFGAWPKQTMPNLNTVVFALQKSPLEEIDQLAPLVKALDIGTQYYSVGFAGYNKETGAITMCSNNSSDIFGGIIESGKQGEIILIKGNNGYFNLKALDSGGVLMDQKDFNTLLFKGVVTYQQEDNGRLVITIKDGLNMIRMSVENYNHNNTFN